MPDGIKRSKIFFVESQKSKVKSQKSKSQKPIHNILLLTLCFLWLTQIREVQKTVNSYGKISLK